MDWHHLGHAGWLVEAAGLRMLFDPLVESRHHGGVFDLHPRRTLDVAALAPDFLFVSHRHPDHFDVPSLRALAAFDPDIVVITSDALVERTARRLGFREVRRIDAGTHVSLDGVRFVTTPSVDPNEWGVMVACDGAVAWNQIDTVHRSRADVEATVRSSLAALDEREVTLLLARWQPLLEIEAQMGGRLAFPHAHYAAILEQIEAVRARAIVPASAGAIHAEPFGFMNALTVPLPQARFLRDSGALPAVTGGTYRMREGDVTLDREGARPLLAWCDEERPDPRVFRPFFLPDVFDPNLDAHDERGMRESCERWIRERVAPCLARYDAKFVLEVVFPTARDAFTFEKGDVERRFDDDWDALVTIAGSMLVDVVAGRRHWGDPLLAGVLRSSTRRRALPAIFLYEALGYDESFERAIEHALG